MGAVGSSKWSARRGRAEGSVARVPALRWLRARRAREDARLGIRRGHPREPRVVVHGLGRADAERGPKRVGEEARVAETRCFVGRVGDGDDGEVRGDVVDAEGVVLGAARQEAHAVGAPTNALQKVVVGVVRAGRGPGGRPRGRRGARTRWSASGARSARTKPRRRRPARGTTRRRPGRPRAGPARTPGTPTRASRAPSPGPRRRRGVAESVRAARRSRGSRRGRSRRRVARAPVFATLLRTTTISKTRAQRAPPRRREAPVATTGERASLSRRVSMAVKPVAAPPPPRRDVEDRAGTLQGQLRALSEAVLRGADDARSRASTSGRDARARDAAVRRLQGRAFEVLLRLDATVDAGKPPTAAERAENNALRLGTHLLAMRARGAGDAADVLERLVDAFASRPTALLPHTPYTDAGPTPRRARAPVRPRSPTGRARQIQPRIRVRRERPATRTRTRRRDVHRRTRRHRRVTPRPRGDGSRGARRRREPRRARNRAKPRAPHDRARLAATNAARVTIPSLAIPSRDDTRRRATRRARVRVAQSHPRVYSRVDAPFRAPRRWIRRRRRRRRRPPRFPRIHPTSRWTRRRARARSRSERSRLDRTVAGSIPRRTVRSSTRFPRRTVRSSTRFPRRTVRSSARSRDREFRRNDARTKTRWTCASPYRRAARVGSWTRRGSRIVARATSSPRSARIRTIRTRPRTLRKRGTFGATRRRRLPTQKATRRRGWRRRRPRLLRTL